VGNTHKIFCNKLKQIFVSLVICTFIPRFVSVLPLSDRLPAKKFDLVKSYSSYIYYSMREILNL
jgi:hypothetical protein